MERDGLELERRDEPPGGEGIEDQEGGDEDVRESEKSGRGARIAGGDEGSGTMRRL